MSAFALESAFATSAVPTVNAIAEDVELAEAIGADRRDAAARVGRALLISVGLGEWDAGEDAAIARGGFGLLVLAGLLVRHVGIGERLAAELLGPGDLLRPHEHDGEEATLPFEARWRVLDPVRLAVLDRRWSFRVAPFPEVSIELAGRAVRRSRRLANTMAISHYPRLDDRVLLLLWELADRCGTVRRDGIHVPVPMTHEVVSRLVGARRPSVSGALSRLAATGLVQRSPRGWLLRGEAPALAGRSDAARLDIPSNATGPRSTPRDIADRGQACTGDRLRLGSARRWS